LVVSTLSRFPSAYVEVPFPVFWQVVLCTIAAFVFLNLKNRFSRMVFLFFLVFQVLYLVFKLNERNPDLQVAILDVGQGDASVLTFPNRKMMLIDAGDVMENWDSGLNAVLPFLKTRGTLHIQYAVSSHPHDDHIGGFYSLLQKIRVDTFVINDYSYPSQIYNQILKLCQKRGTGIRRVRKGDYLYPDVSCRVYILHPDSMFTSLRTYDGATCNNTSLVLRIQYGQNQILFPGDLQIDAEGSILYYEDFIESEIIKISHHGAANATSSSLLEFVQPLCAVIPVARKNKFKHPSPHTLTRLQEKGIPYYQTSREGAVLLDVGPVQIRRVNWNHR
jgi:competence protein ComEC